jgi:hypothetical protein
MSDKPEKIDESKLERRRWGKRPSYPFVDANGVLVSNNRRRSVEIRDETAPSTECREIRPEPSSPTSAAARSSQKELPADQLSIESLANESSEFFVDNLTESAPDSGTRLELNFKKWALTLSPNDASCSVGRDDTCDLVMPNRFASRRHGRIEWRDGHFYLCDHSFNGTYVEFDNGKKVHICRDEVRLDSPGRISLGKPANIEKDFIIRFKTT